MTKRTYLSIAVALNDHHAPLELVLDLADNFEDMDTLFDRRRFIEQATVNIRVDAYRLARDIDRELKN